MPKPNSERHRISVDVGAYGRWILDKISEAVGEHFHLSRPASDSQVIRCMLTEFGRLLLPENVWNDRPRHLRT